MAVDLMPHPLVASVAHELKSSNDLPSVTVTAGAAYQKLEDEAKKPSTGGKRARQQEQTQTDEGELAGIPPRQEATAPEVPDAAALEAARTLVGAAGVPQLVTFTGYLGATISRSRAGQDEWTVLYLDSSLRSWMLVQTSGLVVRVRVREDQSPFAFRDAVWVKEDALVGHGMGSFSVEAQFLSGEFTNAADFEPPPLGGGTLSASTGLFCEGRSPGCCRKTPR